ncbi:alpha/beta fold hydrolase [Rehaibacterium terrae]|uniref:Haloalkane dehalogenase n=1 Tax=Rehaibacterium terrae TaxID=1341696 RepID=A0A7W7Y126_9GAMM|nr:alpha/beta fold hydrolase [Rehaibacterium terrae]MBB5016146.1 haloalkane dehalogenase [Rehaibacterium terrae]
MSYPDYPFTGHRFEVRPGIGMHYLDEGQGDPVLMLHGNPSWSYYWRKLVLGLRERYRCVVPDHVGMGLSDKPDDRRYRYTLQSRIDDLATLIDRLDLGGRITLAVHDWGGMIGFGWALQNPARVKRLVILNTAAFPLPGDKPMPWQLKIGRDYNLGALAIRGFNAFAAGAARFGVARPMPADVRRAYTAPYDSWRNRIATLRFVQDIPLSPRDRAWKLVEEAGRRLPEFADRPAFIGWGLKDFVFDKHFLDGFTRALPRAEVHAFEDAGHYVLEDKAETLVPAIREFLDRHPVGAEPG